MSNVQFNINIDGAQVAPAFIEVRIQVVSDRILVDGQPAYLNLTLTSEGIITDVMDESSSESVGTNSMMWDDIVDSLVN
jgi:hypothetical protein